MIFRLALRSALVTLAACALASGSALAAGHRLPRGPQIAFVSYRDGNSNVFLMDLRHGLTRRLIGHPSEDRAPSWSPDGSYLVFESNRIVNQFNLYIIDAEGKEDSDRRITGNTYGNINPAWSPRGDPRIIFLSIRNRNQDVYMLEVGPNGTYDNGRRVTTARDSEYAAVWSPASAGQRAIAYVSARQGNIDIYVRDLTTGEERRVTSHPAIDSAPSWSPDGTQLAFHSNRDGRSQIYVTTLAGDARQLTTHPSENTGPIWSPDGRSVAFISNRDGNTNLYVVDLDAPGRERRLTHHPASDRAPAWSPDGRWIVFVSYRDRDGELYLIRPDGTGLRRLTRIAGEDHSPAWRP